MDDKQLRIIDTTTGEIIEQQSDWYSSLIDDCKAIITEGVFTSRWALVEMYWNLGERFDEVPGEVVIGRT